MADAPTRRKRRLLITPGDVALWARLTRSVKPLPETPPVTMPPPEDDDDTIESPPFDLPGPRLPPPRRDAGTAPKRHAELSHGSTAGVDKRTAERFRKGGMEIEGRLDLHGLTRDAARGALTAFIRTGASRGHRMVLVITGKGRRADGDGVLKAEVPRWLNEPALRPLILSFSYAQPRDGGEGALYVFLKRNRNE